MKSEKRRHVRFKAPENLFAALGNSVPKVGKVKDISMGGLAFEYIPNDKKETSTSHVDIFLSGNGFYLSKVPCKAAYDITLEVPLFGGYDFSSIDINRCGVAFNKLKKENYEQLVHLLEHHTTEMVP